MIAFITLSSRVFTPLKVLVLLLLVTQYAHAETSWVKSWYAAPSDAGGVLLLANTTFRQTITPNSSGNEIRIRLSNVLGKEDITVKDVTISQQSTKAGAVSGSFQKLTFGGSRKAVIPKGGYISSDPVHYDVIAFQRYHISFMPLTTTNKPTRHAFAYEVPYVSLLTPPEGAMGAFFLPLVGPLQQSWVLLDSLEIKSNTNKKVVLAVGDSITDGAARLIDLILVHPAINTSVVNTRYTDYLARKLHLANHHNLVVLNAGLGSNAVAHDSATVGGPSLHNRLKRDVLDIPNLKTVILLEGINDLTVDSKTPGAGQRLIEHLTEVVGRLKAEGVNVMLGTITPIKDMSIGLFIMGNFAEYHLIEAERQIVNEWIRNQNLSDSVVDFDKCLRDPNRPIALKPEYNSGDSLHPSQAGRKAMADCIDISKL